MRFRRKWIPARPTGVCLRYRIPFAVSFSTTLMSELASTTMTVPAGDAGKRLDQFLAASLDGVSRARVQDLILQHKVLVDGASTKASLKLRGGEQIKVLG